MALLDCPTSSPLWAKKVSREETLTRLEAFQARGFRTPNWNETTRNNMRTSEKYWKGYCEHINKDYLELAAKCDPYIFQGWIDWMARTSKPKMKSTYVTYWNWLSECYMYWFHKRIDQSTLSQVNLYINGDLVQDHQVSNHARRKDTLSAEDLGVLLRYHWIYDTSSYNHERLRVQMSLLMLFSAFTGTRPGVLVNNNSSSKRSNFLSDIPSSVQKPQRLRTVCYKDIELYLLKNADEVHRDIWVAEVEFVNLKGRKEGEDGTIFMMHEDDQLAFCPITHIVALAFADNAFESGEEVLTPDMFWKLKVPCGSPVFRLRWRQEKQNTPLFPHIGRVSPDFNKPMSYEIAHSSLQRLGRSAGFVYS